MNGCLLKGIRELEHPRTSAYAARILIDYQAELISAGGTIDRSPLIDNVAGPANGVSGVHNMRLELKLASISRSVRGDG